MRKIGKILGYTLLGLVTLVLLVPVLLYIPFVQDLAVRIATEQVEQSTGMHIEVDRLRLGFPLKLRLHDVTVLQANADTMVTAARATANVRLMPLLHKRIDVESVELDSAFYQLGNADSLMWLRARLEKGVIDGFVFDMATNDITLHRADIDGIGVNLRMLEDTVTKPQPATESTPYLIKADLIKISRLAYNMEMLPVIDSLGATVDCATLRNAVVDMAHRRISGQSLRVDSVGVSYIYPAVTAAATTKETEVAPTPESEMWTITADTLRLTARDALYAARGAVPMKGFDPQYIAGTGIVIEVDSFYNRGTSIRVPLRRLDATERCGLPLHADGLFSMDGSAMEASGFVIETLRSALRFDASMGIGDLTADPSLPLALKGNGRIDPSDIALAFPDMAAMLAPMKPTSLNADIEGTAGLLNIYQLGVVMPDVMRLQANGSVSSPFDPDKIGGDLSIDGSLAALSDRQFAFLPIAHTPALSIKGDAEYHPGEATGAFTVTTSGGSLAAEGSWSARPQDYDADISVNSFPVDAFMPELGVGRVTGRVRVDGRGYNPMLASTSIDADMKVASIHYNKNDYKNIALDLSLHGGEATGKLTSANPGADATALFTALLEGDTVRYDLTANLRDVNLLTLGLSDSVCAGRGDLHSSGYYDIISQGMDVKADVSNLYWRLPGIVLNPVDSLRLALVSGANGANATLNNGDLSVGFSTPAPILAFADSLTPAINEIMTEVDSMRLNVELIQNLMPRFAMQAQMGQGNVVSDYLKSMDISFKSVSMAMANDSLISLGADLRRLAVGSTRLDTISINMLQHGDYLAYKATVNNKPGTFDDFAHVNLSGFAGFNRASVFMSQRNIKGERGFTVGVNAAIADSILTVNIVPRKPIIAYKTWTLNDSNFISYDLTDRHIDADLRISSGDSYIKIFTPAHAEDSAVIAHHSHSHTGQEDIIVQMANVQLQDWLSINPFAPPVKGELGADLHFRFDDKSITGKGNVGLTDLYYGNERVGTFGLDVDVSNDISGQLMANVEVSVDSVKTITAHGVLNDSTLATPFLLDFDMIRFPLRVVNPFLPAGTASLAGVLNGTMKITGDMAAPRFDGYINFDSASVNVAMLGTRFGFSDEKIPVDSNIITFDKFAITGCNANPLTIDGSVDARHLTDILIDLTANAKNIQVVNSSRSRGADVYGKAFLDLDASVKGSTRFLAVNADVTLLPATNCTYVVSEAQSGMTSAGGEDMVKFVEFADSAQTAAADTITTNTMMMTVNADLHLRQGSTVNVDMAMATGGIYAHVQPQGDLNFSMSPINGMRMTGRLNIMGGNTRITIPPISAKDFTFRDNSYVAFNGDILNPVLNIQAVDVLKANVTQSGQNSRLVNFDVGLGVTGTLENMNVAFDVSTDDDITVQNELQSMSPAQRANQAMNLLLYGSYTGSGTKATTNLGGNPLFSFLTSSINSWAADNIKGVDISFGIDQYDRTYEGSTSTATSYSYRVSKSLFDDRFKIVVGGNYSTDADTDENFSQNLINDISFEYLLNRSGSMYIRIFRHTGYESILEGEITQTGVGFVLKRKLNSLWELFGIRREPKNIK